MSKVTFLLSHIPNPRILKRVKAIEDNFDISVIYWDRGMSVKEDFTISPRHEVYKILISAPMGKPLKRIFPLMKFKKKALNKLIDIKPNIIHAANLDMLSIANSYKKKYDSDVKIIYEIADLAKHSFKSNKLIKEILFKGMRKYEKLLTKDISYIFLTSPYFWDNYYSKFIDKEKYLFVPNAPYKKLFEAYRGKNKNEPFTIGFIGSVRYIDQLKMLIDAVEEIEDSEIRVLIAGSGPGLEAITDYSKDKPFVNIYGPYDYIKDIVYLYEKVDIVYSVYDSSLENTKIALPNRLYESIVCELPIIGSSNTELGRIIDKNEIGFTVSSKDEIISLLNKINNNQTGLNSIKSNCYSIKESYYFENIEFEIKKRYGNL